MNSEPSTFQDDLEHCLQTLHTGGLILYPTDTVWGIGCDATHPAAVSKVFALKRRAETKSLIVLLADQRDILKYTSHPDPAIFDYLHTTRRPTTVIYDGPLGLADNLAGPENTIAIRLVAEPFCKHLIKRFRKPIVSTSANLSGQPTPSVFSEIGDEIKQGVDYIVRHRRDDNRPAEPSSVVKWERNGTLTVIRP
jgi:L-threonylcarbamoyladenylate synthase